MSFTDTIYRGYDLLGAMPNNREERDQRWRSRVDLLASGTGQAASAPVWPGPVLDHPFTWTLEGRAEITAFLAWVALRRGRYWPCWLPTWRQDLVLADSGGSGDTAITIVASDYTATLFPSESRRHLAILTPAAGTITVTPRRVTEAIDNGDGTETLTLEASPGLALPLGTMLSYLVLARLASDDVELLWYHRGAVEVTMDFVELPRQLEAAV